MVELSTPAASAAAVPADPAARLAPLIGRPSLAGNDDAAMHASADDGDRCTELPLMDAANPRWALAQINIARLAAAKGDPLVQPFFDALDAMNALADASPGFLWRLEGEGGDATDLNPTGDDRVIVNLSAWSSREALHDYVYRSDHRLMLGQRRVWFERHEGAYQALWWVPAGEWPSAEEGLARLGELDRFGPTPTAFTFKTHFPPPGAPQPKAAATGRSPRGTRHRQGGSPAKPEP